MSYVAILNKVESIDDKLQSTKLVYGPFESMESAVMVLQNSRIK